MTATWVLALGMVGILLLLSVVTYHLVAALRQVRQTTQAVEELVRGTRPKIDEGADRLRSVLGRADRILAAAEGGEAAIGSLVESVAKLVGGWRTGAQAASMVWSFVQRFAPGGDFAAGAAQTRPATGGDP